MLSFLFIHVVPESTLTFIRLMNFSFLFLPYHMYASLYFIDASSHEEPDSEYSFVGHVEISKEASLQELKLQVCV